MSPNLWDLAVRSLNDELRQLIDFGLIDSLQALREVARLAEEKKNQSIRSRLKIRRKSGENIILRDVFEKIVKYVQKFKEIGDVAVQYDTAHASLPWAGVRLLLQFAINETQTFSFMLEGLGLVTNLIARYAIVEDLYLREHTNAAGQLSASLIQLYAAILTFLGKTYRFFGQNISMRMLKSTFTLSDNGLEHLLRDIEQKQVQVDRSSLLLQADRQKSIEVGVLETNIQALDISQSLDASRNTMLSENATMRKKMEILLQLSSELNGPVHRIALQLSDIEDKLDVSRRARILSWLSNIPYEQHHQNSRKGRLLDSGTWLLRKLEYLSWRSSSFSSILWLHGIPGSGKTTLLSLVIDEVSREITTGQNLPPIAYFYCARDPAEPERSNPKEILLSIARQLSGKDHTLPIRTPTADKYFASTSLTRRRLTLQEAVDLIISLTDENPATIIIDALDECDALHRYELLEALDVIIQQSSNIVKIFVSSREDSDILCKLENSPNLYIGADDNKRDIENFIRAEVAEAILKKRLLNGNVSIHLRQLIIETLERGAQGMFRWVSLQIQNLCNPRRMKIEADVLQELGKLPKSLSDLYAVIYDQIQESGPYSKRMAESILQWLTVAQQPLSDEMAIAVVSGGDFNAHTPLGYRDLLNMTCNLTVVDRSRDVIESQDIVPFAHLSVREYLETRTEFSSDEVHMRVAMTCLEEYVNMESPFRMHTLPDVLKVSLAGRSSVLRSYSSVFWPFHTTQVDHKAQRLQLLDLLRRSLFRSADASCSFTEWRKHVANLSPQLPSETRVEINAARTPFLAICIFGISEMLELYEESDILVYNQRLVPKFESRYAGMNGLHITTYQGHFRSTRTLLTRGVGVNEPTASAETCLHIAVRKERKHLLQLLVHHGADMNALSIVPSKQEIDLRDTRGPWDSTDGHRPRSSLGFRTGTGSISSAIDEAAEAPLHHAALHGFSACVSELLRLGADVNVRDSLGATPLLKALEGWHGDIIQELLPKADINIPLMYGRTPLHFAAASGQYETASLLLRYGANPHLQDFLGSSSIQTARRYNNDQLARMLEAFQFSVQFDVVPQQPIPIHWKPEAEAEAKVESPSSRPTNLKIPKIVFSEWNSLLTRRK